MKILFNASTVKFGGGLTIALNLMKSFNNNCDTHTSLLISPKNFGYEEYRSPKIKLITVPTWLLLKIFRLILNYIWINRVTKKFKPDIIFSLGNIALPTKITQAHLLSNPFVVVDNYRIFKLSLFELIIQKLRTICFQINLNYTNLIFAQTEVIRKRLIEKFNIHHDINVIPMGYSQLYSDLPPSGKYEWLKSIEKVRLLCFTRYYQHKNLEILLDLGNIIQKNNKKYVLIITIPPKQSKKGDKLLNRIKKMGLTESIINIGTVDQKDIKELYNNIDGLILPTLLESFSSTYVDAMHYRKPIFTSNRDFALEVCGNAGIYFNPLDVNDIFTKINKSFEDQNLIDHKIKLGIERINQIPGWSDIITMYISGLEKIMYNGPG